jgi:hypothetical protein
MAASLLEIMVSHPEESTPEKSGPLDPGCECVPIYCILCQSRPCRALASSLALMLVSAVILVTGFGLCRLPETVKAVSYESSGQRALVNGNYVQAEKELLAATQTFPDSGPLWASLAEAGWQAHDDSVTREAVRMCSIPKVAASMSVADVELVDRLASRLGPTRSIVSLSAGPLPEDRFPIRLDRQGMAAK